jgi:glycerol-3-phosphate cytidylyltransferase
MRDGKKVGITAGAFDLCHAGHMLVFKEAKTVCDYLIVALQEDPSNTPADYRGKKKNKPVMSLEERRIILESVRYVDEIVTYNTEEELHDLLVKLKPDIRIIGADWKGKQYTGHELPIEMYFNTRGHNFSTTALRERIYEAELEKRKNVS